MYAAVLTDRRDTRSVYTGPKGFALRDSDGFCQIVSSQRENNFSSASQGRVLTPRSFFFAFQDLRPNVRELLLRMTGGDKEVRREDNSGERCVYHRMVLRVILGIGSVYEIEAKFRFPTRI